MHHILLICTSHPPFVCITWANRASSKATRLFLKKQSKQHESIYDMLVCSILHPRLIFNIYHILLLHRSLASSAKQTLYQEYKFIWSNQSNSRHHHILLLCTWHSLLVYIIYNTYSSSVHHIYTPPLPYTTYISCIWGTRMHVHAHFSLSSAPLASGENKRTTGRPKVD